MIRQMAIVAVVCLGASTLPLPASPVGDVYKRVKASVVVIETTQKDVDPALDMGLVSTGSLGSGVLISDDGKIMTAAHVVQIADRILVRFPDGEEISARVLSSEPAADVAPSNLAVMGRYLFTADIFEHLHRVTPGVGNEIQLTDAMARLLGRTPFHGYRFEGKRYDCGDKVGFLEANIAFALARDELRDDVRAVLGGFA